jgi:hypothetical protein
MALPTLVRTWQFQNNIYLPNFNDLSNEVRKVMWTIKNTLVSFPIAPWKCVASSNAAACLRYGVDALGPPGPAYDNWTTYANLHCRDADGWSTYDSGWNSKHSWIVLRNTALDTTYDLCIDLYLSSNQRSPRGIRYPRIYICRSYNLTGSGSITARPTPNSGYIESELRNSNTDNYGTVISSTVDSQFYTWRIHAQMSTDGLGTRLFLFGDGLLLGFWAFDRILGADPSYPNPVWACIRGKYDTIWDAASYGWMHDTSTHQKDAWGTTDMNFYLSTESLGSSTIGEAWSGYPNEVSGNYPMTPIGVASPTVGKRGRIGYLQDIWFGEDFWTGILYPSGGSKLFASMGSLVVPWDGTSMVYIN